MSTFTVSFLGKDFIIPQEVKTYMNYMDLFSPFIGKAMEPLERYIHSNSDYWEPIDWKKELTPIAYEIIQELAKQKVYNITVTDLIDNNEGFIRLLEINGECSSQSIEILKKATSDYINQYQNAYNIATSKITGTGTSVFTSDPLAYLVLSNRETNAINRQITQANIEYQNAINRLNRNNADWVSKRMSELKYKTYCPACTDAFPIFASSLFSIFIEALNRAGVFNYDAIRHYNIVRSSELLNNFQYVEDKKGLLREAFEVCPYNSKVFDTAVDNGIIDMDFISAADNIGVDITKDALIAACKKAKEQPDVKFIIKSIASKYDIAEEDVSKEVFSIEKYIVESAYSTINKLLQNPAELDYFIQRYITTNKLDFILKDSSTLHEQVEKYISELLPLDTIDLLLDKYIAALQEFNGSTNSKEIQKDAIVSLFDRIIQYQSEIMDSNTKLSTELHELEYKKNRIKEARQSTIQTINAEIDDCLSQLDKLGAFHLRKKKELKEQILNLQSELQKDSTQDELNIIDERIKSIKESMEVFDNVLKPQVKPKEKKKEKEYEVKKYY